MHTATRTHDDELSKRMQTWQARRLRGSKPRPYDRALNGAWRVPCLQLTKQQEITLRCKLLVRSDGSDGGHTGTYVWVTMHMLLANSHVFYARGDQCSSLSVRCLLPVF